MSESTTDICLAGKKIVITGKFKMGDGDFIDGLAEAAGAKLQSSVGKSTAYLVVGERPGGSKMRKAEANNTPQLTEEDFLAAIPRSIPSLTEYLNHFLNTGWDISFYSNESDGYCGNFSVDYPTDASTTKDALATFAKTSEEVSKRMHMKEEARRPSDAYQVFDSAQPELGWTYNADLFSCLRNISIRKYNKRKDDWDRIPGRSMVQVMSHLLEDVDLLALHSSKEYESVIAVHVIGGKNKSNGKLEGIIIHRVWT